MSMSFDLIPVSGAARTTLKPGMTLTVGRHGSQDLVLQHSSISRRHARLSWPKGSPRPFAEDLGSSNGTWLDGYRLIPNEQAPLTHRALLQFGELVFEACLRKSVDQLGDALLEDSGRFVTLLGGGKSLRGASHTWRELRELLLRVEDEQRTGTLTLEFAERVEVLTVLLGTLVVSAEEGLELFGALRAYPGPVRYELEDELELGTVGVKGKPPSELLARLGEDRDDEAPTQRIK